MNEIELIRTLNSIFDRFDFKAMRDAMEGSSADTDQLRHETREEALAGTE